MALSPDSSIEEKYIPLPRRELEFVCNALEMKAELCTGMPLPRIPNPTGSPLFGASTPSSNLATSDRSITNDESSKEGFDSTRNTLETSINQGDTLTAVVCFRVLVYDSMFKNYMWNSNNRAILSKIVNTEVERTERAEKAALLNQ
jgi:hypothetical protein